VTRSAAAALRGASAVQVAAQAKVNLRLRILAREANGFHQLETLLLRLDLADTIRVRRTDASRTLDVAGDVDADALGPTERNLAWRAAVAYCDVAGWTDGFAIELEKRIPIGGGLGGGSADAGAVLRAMDAMAKKPLGQAALLRIAFTLGADVPFFTSGHAYALAWGRGERLLALKPPPRRTVALIVPSFGEAGGVLQPAALSDWKRLLPLAVNDFEPVVITRHPIIGALLEGLRGMGCAPALMSGSGSVVFGVMPLEAGGVRFLPDAADGPVHVRGLTTMSANRVEPVTLLD